MPRIRKSTQSLGLYKQSVLIDDNRSRSEYFKVSQFDGYFYGGRNAFLVAGNTALKANSKILVEVTNSDGTVVYSAPVPSFIEGGSRLVYVEVYKDTPIGSGKLVLLGCAERYSDGSPIPKEWQDKYNVRWSADVIISPLVKNRTPIRFRNTPSMLVEEKFYFAPSSSAYFADEMLPLDVTIEAKNYSVYPNGYVLKVVGPNTPESGSRFFSKHLGGILSGTLNFERDSVPFSASVALPIAKIYSRTMALSEGQLIYTNGDRIVLGGMLSSSGAYISNITPFGSGPVTSSLSLNYSELIVNDTGSVISFAKIRLVDLQTLSGEINKVKVSYKPATEPGEYTLLGEASVAVSELLSVDSGSTIVHVGEFNEIDLTEYWYSATMSLARDAIKPTLPDHYYTSSIGTAPLQSCHFLLNAVSGTPATISGSFIDDVSYFIGTKSSIDITLFPRSEYTLSFKAFVAKISGSVELSQSDYTMEVFLINESGSSGKILSDNPRGQFLGKLTPTSTFQKQNFETVEFNFVPKINEATECSLRFVVYGGFWNIADVSLKSAKEPFFSSDEIDILIPNMDYSGELLEFKTEYLDVNNNSINISTLSIPTYFSGSGLGRSNSALSASYAESASYVPGVATVAFVINGGANPIATGFKGSIRIPTNVTIADVGVYTNDTGSINVDIVKQVHSSYNPSSMATSIVGTPLSMSNDIKYLDTGMAGWTLNLETNDILNFWVTEVDGVNLKIATIVFNLFK